MLVQLTLQFLAYSKYTIVFPYPVAHGELGKSTIDLTLLTENLIKVNDNILLCFIERGRPLYIVDKT